MLGFEQVPIEQNVSGTDVIIIGSAVRLLASRVFCYEDDYLYIVIKRFAKSLYNQNETFSVTNGEILLKNYVTMLSDKPIHDNISQSRM